VDKNLKQHGLIQAFSRTNRILNSVKTYGNIICFRDLKEKTDEAIALFGNKDASGIVLLKTYDEYYNGYDEKGEYRAGYKELIEALVSRYALGNSILGEDEEKNFIRLYGVILKLKNILVSFDDFAGNEILSEREFQDYQSIYLDLYQKYRRGANADKEVINDDIVFEIELIKQIEVNIDYILMLVEKYKESSCNNKSILTDISKAIGSSIELRSKKELIENFIEQVNVSTEVGEDWRKFLDKSIEEDILKIIEEESLKPQEARRFIDNALRDGVLKTTGTSIDNIMPPVSRFGGARTAKKQAIIEKLMKFFEKYSGLA
jgi:type I restriction enzyme R subunit